MHDNDDPSIKHKPISKNDTPPSSLMDSIVSPRKKTTEGKGLGARSLTHNTLGVEGRARALGWD
jgi:hypothetical protein